MNSRWADRRFDPIVFTVFCTGKLDVAVSITLTWGGTAARNTDYTVSVSGTGATLSAMAATLAPGEVLKTNAAVATIRVAWLDGWTLRPASRHLPRVASIRRIRF